MRVTRPAVLLCLVATAACQPAPRESPSVSPSPITFSVIGEGPVIEPADYGAAYLLPGGTVFRDGTTHLFAVAFSADADERARVLHLTSGDGVTWSGDPEASVLEDFGLELDRVGGVPASAYVADDGTWTMYGGGRLPGGVRTVAWRATAPDPGGPWTAHPSPILEPASSGWDNAIVDHPSVVATADGYLLAYGGAGLAAPNRSRIGMATSDDGVSWTRVDATIEGADDAHALGPDACGIDARTMVEPHVLSVGTHLLLVFDVMVEGTDTNMQIVTATSPDGRAWTCASGTESLGSEDFPGRPAIHSFAVIDEPGGSPSLLVEVLGQGSSTLWLARADG